MPVDHIGFNVADFAASRVFYTAALAPLGYAVTKEGEGWALLGQDGGGALWFGAFGPPPGRIHLAFTAATRSLVHAFYDAALQAGGIDNGGPGLRPQYHESYYGAFVIDPNGHNLEAVCHRPE